MASGECTISGVYVVSDTTHIKEFYENYGTGDAGESAFVIPAGGNVVYLGIISGAGVQSLLGN